MFDGKLEFVSGGDDILPPVGQRNWPWDLAHQLAPWYITTSSKVITGWDPLWSLECVSARDTYLSGNSTFKTFVNRLNGQDIRDIWSSVKSLLSTGRFIKDTSSFTDRELSNYQPEALPSRYFANSMMAVSDATPYDNSMNYYTGSSVGVSRNPWGRIFTMLGGMNNVFPACVIQDASSSLFTISDEADGSVGTKRVPVEESGLLYWHMSYVYYKNEYGSLFLEEYRKRKGTLERDYSENAPCAMWSCKYGPSGEDKIASHVYMSSGSERNLDMWAVMKVTREKVNWEQMTVDAPIVKYVFLQIPYSSYITMDSSTGNSERVLFFDVAKQVSNALSISGTMDDVTLPSKQFIDDNYLWFTNIHYDRLLVQLVDLFPVVRFKHTKVDI